VSAGQNATAGGPTAIEAEVSDFDLVTQAIGTATVIAVSGELDVATVPRLRAALTEAAERGSTRLVVDLTEVTFVDSVSVGAILHAQKRLGLEGRLAVVLAPSSYARVIFDVVGADAVLDVVQTRAQALSRVTD
jgi:anti-sigma B factor antagonist